MKVFENITIDNIAFISQEDASDMKRIITLLCDYMTIYVYDSCGKLYGIITIGDFNRHSKESEYINANFLYVIEGNNLNQDIERIIKMHRTIQEIPVLNVDGKLLYVKKRVRHMINSFNFDWALCSNDFAKQFFNGYKRICYFQKSNKIQGLKKFIGLSVKIEQLNSIKECKSEDVLIIHQEYLGKDVKAYNIDEVYLTILSRTVVHNILIGGEKYFFFQTPIVGKCRKENQIYYSKEINSLAANKAELINIFGDYTDAIRYWTEHDYLKVNYCEINGSYLLENVQSCTYNVENNHRVTSGQPAEYLYTIYIVGTCIARGFGVSDNLTIPSLLQMKLNKEGITKYRVVNCGIGGGLNLYSDIRDFVNICKMNIKKNDIIIHLGYNCWELEKSRVEFDNYYELSWIFNRRIKKDALLTMHHI